MTGDEPDIRPLPLLVAALACASGALLSLYAAPGREGWFGAGLLLLAAAIALVDYRRLLIPDALNLAVLALGLTRAALTPAIFDWTHLADAAARGLAFGGALLLVRQVYWLTRGRHGLGLGDVKLAGAGGVWLQWPSLPIAVEIAALSALAAYALWAHVTKSSVRWTSRLPFGLFLAPAIWAAWLIEVWLD